MHHMKSIVTQIVDSNQKEPSVDTLNISTTKDDGNVVCLPLPDQERLANIEKSLGGNLSDIGKNLSEADDDSLIELALSFSNKYADLNFEFLRPKDIKLCELIRKLIYSPSNANIYPAVNSFTAVDYLLPEKIGSENTFIMPFRDLMCINSDGRTKLHLEFDRNILWNLIDYFGFKNILAARTQKETQQVTDECSKRVEFIEKAHEDLLQAARNDDPVQIIFIDFDKYDWMQRENKLIEADDFVHLDTTLWDVKYESGRLNLIRRS